MHTLVLCWGLLLPGAAPPVEATVTTAGFALLSPTGQGILTAEDIVSYDPRRHTLTLRPGVKRRLLEQHLGQLVSGCPFVVMANGQSCYEGVLTTSFASNVHTGVVIDLTPMDEVLPDEITLSLGYPTASYFRGIDPRDDPRVRESLAELGKLR